MTYIRIKTVGVLEPPSITSGNARTLALALPLGSVPSQRDDSTYRNQVKFGLRCQAEICYNF